MSRYVNIDSIVKSAIIDIGDTTEHSYQRFLHWAFECARDISFDTALEVKTVRLTMSNAKTIDLPPDLVDFTKVGVVMGDRVKTYIINSRLEISHDVDECGNPVDKPTTTGLDGLSLGGYYFNNYLGGTVFGYGGTCNNIGYCRLDKKRNQLVFSSEVDKTDVYLEYITDGANPDGESMVQQYCAKAVKLYILWMRKEGSRRFNETEKDRAERLYYNELRKARARLTAFSLDDFIAATRKGYLDDLETPLFSNTSGTSVQTIVAACVDSEGVGFCKEKTSADVKATCIIEIVAFGPPLDPFTCDFDSLTVDGVEIMSGSVAFTGTIGTARTEVQKLIDNINAFVSVPNYTVDFLDGSNPNILITADVFGESVNGITPIATITNTVNVGVSPHSFEGGSLEVLEVVQCTQDSPESQPDGHERVYWGSKASPYIDTSSGVATLISEWAPDKLFDKFIEASSEYLYFSYPVSFGTTASFDVDGNSETWTLIEITNFTDIYSTQSYYIYKSPAKKTGSIHVIVL